MTVDRSKIDELIDGQVKAIEADHGDKWEIKNALCVLQAETSEGSEVRVRFSGDDPTAAYGLLKLAEKGFLKGAEFQEEEDDDESPSDS